MRYLIQLLIPALIVIAVTYVLLRSRSRGSERSDNGDNSDKGMIIAILVIGAVVAVGVVVVMQGVWDTGP